MVTTRSSSVGLKADVAGSSSTAAKEENFKPFSLQSFLKRVDKLSGGQKLAIEKAGFGNLLKIPSFRLSNNLLVELMDKWCPDKRAFVLFQGTGNNCSALAINLVDVALVLGLRVVGDPVTLHEDERFIELEKEYGAARWNRRIDMSSIEKRLDSIGDAVNEDFVRSFLLFMFGKVLFPTDKSKVDSRYLYLLQDLEKVSHFAWGAAVLTELIHSLCERKKTNQPFAGGCLIFLQIWSYEHIEIARPSLQTSPINYPRACRWKNSGPHSRQSIRTKFKDLDKDQVLHELQLTHEESNVDIIKELLEAQVNGEVLTTENSNIESDKMDDFSIRLKTMDQLSQTEQASTSVASTDFIDLCTPYKVSEQQKGLEEPRISSNKNVDPSITYKISEGQGGQIEPRPSTSPSDSLCVVMISDDDDKNVTRKEETSREENMEERNEIDRLREENKRLKDQLEMQHAELRNTRDETKILKDQLRERNAELDDLRRENLRISSSSDDLVTRLESIVLSAYHEDENERQTV